MEKIQEAPKGMAEVQSTILAVNKRHREGVVYASLLGTRQETQEELDGVPVVYSELNHDNPSVPVYSTVNKPSIIKSMKKISEASHKKVESLIYSKEKSMYRNFERIVYIIKKDVKLKEAYESIEKFIPDDLKKKYKSSLRFNYAIACLVTEMAGKKISLKEDFVASFFEKISKELSGRSTGADIHMAKACVEKIGAQLEKHEELIQSMRAEIKDDVHKEVMGLVNSYKDQKGPSSLAGFLETNESLKQAYEKIKDSILPGDLIYINRSERVLYATFFLLKEMSHSSLTLSKGDVSRFFDTAKVVLRRGNKPSDTNPGSDKHKDFLYALGDELQEKRKPEKLNRRPMPAPKAIPSYAAAATVPSSGFYQDPQTSSPLQTFKAPVAAVAPVAPEPPKRPLRPGPSGSNT